MSATPLPDNGEAQLAEVVLASTGQSITPKTRCICELGALAQVSFETTSFYKNSDTNYSFYCTKFYKHKVWKQLAYEFIAPVLGWSITHQCNAPVPFFQNGAQLRCVFHPTPPGAGCKTRLESRLKTVTPRFDWGLGHYGMAGHDDEVGVHQGSAPSSAAATSAILFNGQCPVAHAYACLECVTWILCHPRCHARNQVTASFGIIMLALCV